VCLGIGIRRVGIHRRGAVWCWICWRRVALDTLVASSTTTTTGSTASKAATCAFGTATYASRYAHNNGSDDEGCDYDYDYDWPSVICEQSRLVGGIVSTHLQ
jgi:hypothetical protein